ncbi:MAG: hypothetical protein PHC51_10345 [bacterium]|nr:hypothetical protein [bacterium]
MDNDLLNTLALLSRILNESCLRYHLTGGMLSSIYGEPRFTQNIDIVINIDHSAISKFVERLSQSDFMINELSVKEAVSTQRMFQALHNTMIVKVDFHVGEDIPGEFDRSIIHEEIFPDIFMNIASKEDAILSKLRWISLGSGKSRADIQGMLKNPIPFDLELIKFEASKLGLADTLADLLKSPGGDDLE